MKTTVRKNFLFDKDIALYLEEIAKDTQKSMTQVLQEMIEERHKKIKVKKRAKALKKIKGSADGLLRDFSIQSSKKSKNV